ncbi:hypothetical protein SAMN05444342_3088 [Haladaptatus paucihalophilus DX253]|uniref:Uncharacterized protein n=1 Tax=Haladaptatus paucihalophilus DX253 TaxID=797209 RepID=A0A1M6Y179_HALPU|nr:hypothetical protein SAMN05444342_3088 [Haladaptatus paucihalophilus DX253]
MAYLVSIDGIAEYFKILAQAQFTVLGIFISVFVASVTGAEYPGVTAYLYRNDGRITRTLEILIVSLVSLVFFLGSTGGPAETYGGAIPATITEAVREGLDDILPNGRSR